MNNISKPSTKDVIIIFFIVVVFVLVFFVFYTEIIKNSKIRESKKHFYIVKEELIKEINKCRQKEQNWVFNISCEEELTIGIIADYFNKIKKLKNPYDTYDGIQGTAGSVQIDIRNKILILSVDIDASGGIDIEHTIY